MIFIDPSLEEVYQSLINNDFIINFLKEQNLLITKASLYRDFTKEQIEDMTSVIFSNNVTMLYDISQVLLDNKDTINSNSIYYLVSNKIGWAELADKFGISPETLDVETYKNIIYTYKYCSVSSFFQNNKDKFLPENDLLELEKNPSANAFIDAMMKEFDKLDCVIGKCCEYLDFDKIPWDLINYLTQLLGFEKTTLDIHDEKKFRELAKNILDVYRMKGTNYSFELFFNFLGFNIEIKEFYFDRRLFYTRTVSNLETNAKDKEKSEFYLTTVSPTKNEIENLSINEIVLPSDITTQYSLNEFNDLCKEYGPEAVLGYSPVYEKTIKYEENYEEKERKETFIYTGKVYKYFKTNVVYYSLKGTDNTSDRYKTILKCLNFLTPSYIRKDLKVDTSSSDQNIDSLDFEGSGYFELLDGEDWSNFGENEAVVNINNKNYLIDENSSAEESGGELSGSLIEYHNSTGGNDYRLPLDYKLINKSTNRFLEGTSGKSSPILLDYKRNKFIIDKSNGNILPYYTVPPYVSNVKNIENVFYKEAKQIDLIGENSVKEQIKNSNIINKIDITRSSLDEILKNNEFNELIFEKIFNRTILEISSTEYGPDKEYKTKEECYNNVYKNYKTVNDLNDLKDYNNYNYYTDEKLKNYNIGDYILANDEEGKKLILYRYGNYKIPIDKKSSNYGRDYKNYLDSFDYKIVEGKLYGRNIKVSVESVSDINVDIIKKRNKMITSANNSVSNPEEVIPLNYLENIYYYVETEKKNYSLKKCNKESDACIYNKTIFETLQEAKEYFGIVTKSKKIKGSIIPYCNLEFFVKEEKQLYIFRYKNRYNGRIFYSTKDEKLYIIKGNSDKDIEEYKNFAGRLTIYHKDPNGEYSIINGIMQKTENGEYSLGYDEDLELYADINLYDENWIGYDEISDEEEFLFYNSKHEVTLPEIGYYNKPISRPVKYATDKKFNVNVGKKIIESIVNESAENFFSATINEKDLKVKINNDIFSNICPSEFELYKNEEEEVTTDKAIDKQSVYYTKTKSGLLSIAEDNMEKITEKINNKFDYYNDLSDFFVDYYAIILLDDYSIKNFSEEFKKDFPPDPTTGEYLANDIEKIKKYYNIAILQMSSVLNNLDIKYLEKIKSIYLDFFNLFSSIVYYINYKSNISDDFLKLYLYNKLVSLYREKFIDDSSNIKYTTKGKKPFMLYPKLKEKYNGKAGSYRTKKTLLSSYKNNDFIKLKFFNFGGSIDVNKKVTLYFDINYKDFVNVLGYDYGNMNGLEEKYYKTLPIIKPMFIINSSNNYYRTNNTLWQKIRKYLLTNYANSTIKLYYNNGYALYNSKGEVLNSNGSIASKPSLAIKECKENGYYRITTSNILNNINIEEINNFIINSNSTSDKINIIKEEEKKFVNGYLVLNNFGQKFIDNRVSFPESLNWVSKDDNGYATEFISFGDDREVNIVNQYSKVTENNYNDPSVIGKYKCEVVIKNGKYLLKAPLLNNNFNVNQVTLLMDDKVNNKEKEK